MTEKNLFAFWTGDNPMNDNRKRGWESFGAAGLAVGSQVQNVSRMPPKKLSGPPVRSKSPSGLTINGWPKHCTGRRMTCAGLGTIRRQRRVVRRKQNGLELCICLIYTKARDMNKREGKEYEGAEAEEGDAQDTEV